MPGAGKSFCVDYLKAKDIPSVYFGGITLEEVEKRGLPINEINEKMVRESIRADEGPGAYAKRIIDKIEKLFAEEHKRVVVDGLYSWTEYTLFEEHFGEQAKFVAIIAHRHQRHERLAKRPVRPLTKEEVDSRDRAEIENLEKGGPIARADYTVLNDSTPEKLLEDFNKVLDHIKF